MNEDITEKVPQLLQFSESGEALDDIAKVQGIAYSGGEISQPWISAKVVVDLAGMEISQQIPIMYNHQYEPGYRLGEAIIEKTSNGLEFVGEIDTSTGMGKALVEAGKKWKWQVSIGAENEEWELFNEGDTVAVNGKAFNAPVYIVRKSKLREISLVAIGADDKTSMEIIAGFMQKDNAEDKENTTANLEAVKQDEPKEQEKNTMDKNEEKKVETPDINAKLEELGNTIAALNSKIETMQKQEEVRASRPAPQVIINHDDETKQADIITAALENGLGIKAKDTRANEIATKKYGSNGIGIKHAITAAARMAGWDGEYITAGNLAEAISYVKAGYANISIPGILGNAANKRIAEGFNYVEQSWKEIAEIVSVNDLKAFSTYRLTAGGEFAKIPAGGNLPEGTLNEQSYENKAETYGMIVSIDRATILNDDMSAIQKNLFQLGRKAGIALNKVFWTAFLNNSSFFSAGNGNIKTSAGELNVANLGAAVATFKKRKVNGELVGGTPAILLVPTSLEITADKLYNDTEVITTASNKTITTGNPFRGKFKPVASAYLEDSTITGNSADDYYLLDDPMAIPAMQVAFLDGRQAPIVESSDAEFDTLGIRYRAYLDFGCTLADTACGIKCDKE